MVSDDKQAPPAQRWGDGLVGDAEREGKKIIVITDRSKTEGQFASMLSVSGPRRADAGAHPQLVSENVPDATDNPLNAAVIPFINDLLQDNPIRSVAVAPWLRHSCFPKDSTPTFLASDSDPFDVIAKPYHECQIVKILNRSITAQVTMAAASYTRRDAAPCDLAYWQTVPIEPF
ncbi:hypothetical protein CH63R_11419 [Colletotrichum higginsianum IMI 349063]|uniref:Uncharacterized protein n=1 Tax=Colletotrichum higginsianum (strain IMI 349063) TaxID=759273 RepID=A0A1B7XY78_COLHI|nr:hypothetical protein CH63R_11419 [Colletotrichum higginsianum IMI 349063]OBR04716.1 hypothetical protein CH63R_11419 [Colletotrichum higginsianum IMI 349063]